MQLPSCLDNSFGGQPRHQEISISQAADSCCMGLAARKFEKKKDLHGYSGLGIWLALKKGLHVRERSIIISIIVHHSSVVNCMHWDRAILLVGSSNVLSCCPKASTTSTSIQLWFEPFTCSQLSDTLET